MTDNEKTQFVGASIPDELFESVNLYSIAKDIPKTQIIRKALSVWAGNENVNRDDLISEITIQCQNNWLRKKAQSEINEDIAFEQHIIEWHQSLLSRHLSEIVIEKILNNIKQ